MFALSVEIVIFVLLACLLLAIGFIVGRTWQSVIYEHEVEMSTPAYLYATREEDV